MKAILRYLVVFGYLARHSLLRDLEYRLDFLSNLISSIAWQNFTLVAITVLGYKTGGFGGWNPDQMILLSGVWMINDGISHFLWYRNIRQLIVDIHTGNLDFWLAKPIDAQFFTSFRRVIVNPLWGVIEGLVIIFYSLHRLGISASIWGLLGFLLLIVVAAVIYYSLWFIAATATIHFTLADNLFSVVPDLVSLSKFPPSSYPDQIFMLFISLVPILILTAFPAQQLMGLLHPSGFMYAVGVGILLLIISRRFWSWSLRHYSSASS